MRLWTLAWVGAMLACHGNTEPWTPAATRDTKDDPAKVRPGYGDESLHVWWPLADPEVEAIKQIEAAKKGDMHALLQLALVASGDVRDAAQMQAMHAKVDRFIAELKPTIAAADDAQGI